MQLRLGEPIADIGPDSITLKSGEVLAAGVVYKCVGVMPNTAMLKDSPFDRQRPAAARRPPARVRRRRYDVARLARAQAGPPPRSTATAHNIAAHASGHLLLSYPDGVVGAKTTPKIFCLSLGSTTRRSASTAHRRLDLRRLKWLLERTKVAAANDRPVGVLFEGGRLDDALGRTLRADLRLCVGRSLRRWSVAPSTLEPRRSDAHGGGRQPTTLRVDLCRVGAFVDCTVLFVRLREP